MYKNSNYISLNVILYSIIYSGSWFIQEVCKIFKAYGNQLTFLECIREIMISMREKEGTIDGNPIAQLSEIRQDRLELDFRLKQITPAVSLQS